MVVVRGSTVDAQEGRRVDAGLVDTTRRVRPLAGWPHGRGTRTLAAATLGLLALTNALVIVWLWLHGGGISAVHGLGDLSTSVGRITGLLSAYLALIQVLLLARLPVLERLVGFDRLTVWHRLNGK